jgi:hypothetical protein
MMRKIIFGIFFGLLYIRCVTASASGTITPEVPLPNHGSIQFILPEA